MLGELERIKGGNVSNAMLVYDDLVARGKRLRTAKLWRGNILMFEQCCGVQSKYGRTDVVKFLSWLRGRNVKQNSINTVLRAVKLLCTIQEWDGGWPKLAMPKVRGCDVSRPALSVEDIRTLIYRARALCDDKVEVSKRITARELSYIVLSTVYGLRREEIGTAQVCDGGLVRVETMKGGEPVEQLIPDVVAGYLAGYVGCKDVRFMSRIFRKIMSKCGLEGKAGYGWHCIRRALATELVNTDISTIKVLRFMRWSDSSMKKELGMLAVYAKREQDKIDRAVFEVHPFLNFWDGMGNLDSSKEVSYSIQNVNSLKVLSTIQSLLKYVAPL